MGDRTATARGGAIGAGASPSPAWPPPANELGGGGDPPVSNGLRPPRVGRAGAGDVAETPGLLGEGRPGQGGALRIPLTSAIVVITLLLVLALSAAAVYQVLNEYRLLGEWASRSGPVSPGEIRVLRRDIGSRIFVRSTALIVLLLCTTATLWLQQRQLAVRRALHHVTLLARDILVSMDQGVITTDLGHEITSVNAAAMEMLGVGPECAGQPLDRLGPGGSPLVDLVRRVSDRRAPVWDQDFSIGRGGRLRRIRADAHVLKDRKGQALGCVLLLRDVSERALMEEQVRRMERFLSLGTLASGLHHEIKNPLTALSIHVQLLEKRLRDPSRRPVEDLLGVLKSEVLRLNGVLESFRDFASLQRLTLRPADVEGVLEEVARLIAPQAAGQRIDVAVHRPGSSLPPVPLDVEKIKQALLNLVINAIEAMPEGGALTLAAAAGDGEVVVEVSDTGPGIPPEVQPSLFKPYFSTKARGTGMGLALTEKLVGQHGGRIEFRTSPAGTTFSLAHPAGAVGRGEGAGMSDERFRILIVDDEPNIRSGLAMALEEESYDVTTAADASQAWEQFRRSPHQLVITDLRMPGPRSGLDLVRDIKSGWPETLILVVTAHGTVETAVEAMRYGAHDYITKPVDLEMLGHQVRRAFEHYRLREEVRRLHARLAAAGEVPEIIGQSPAILEMFNDIRNVADTDLPILIQGESGTGKELVARAIHNLSGRRDGPFVAANAGAIPETLIESELFGYEKGAFSGAAQRKPGWFEMAQRGTLLLDEIGEMAAKTQVNLLRVIEQREVRRLGGDAVVPLDVRLVAATHRDVDELVAEGKIRQDLYYRLNVVPLRIPPLRERRDDVPALVVHFLERACERLHREPKRVAEAAMRVLCDYSWPGNVRQLRNCIERLVAVVEGPVIHVDDLPREMRVPPPRPDVLDLETAVQETEKATILAALAQCNNHRERTAAILGISVRTLRYKMNRYALQ